MIRATEPDTHRGPNIGRVEQWTVLAFILFALGIAALGFVGGADDFLAEASKVQFGTVLGMLGLSLLNYALRAWRWHLLCRSGKVGVGFLTNAIYFIAGFAFTVTPAKVGEAIRLWLLRHGHRAAYEQTAGVLVADRLHDATAILILCVVSGWLTTQSQAPAAIAAVFVVIGTILLMRPAIVVALIELGYRIVGRRPRIFVRLRRTGRRLENLGSPSLYLKCAVLSLAGWCAEAVALVWILSDLGADVGALAAVFAFSLGMLVGAASMVPGGLGGTEIGMTGALVLAGASLEAAVTATVVLRATTLWFSVVLGFALLPLAMRLARATRAG